MRCSKKYVYLYPKGYTMESSSTTIAKYFREKRKMLNLTQPDLASKAGVGLRFIRDLEQGKTTLRMDKVNQVLKLFGQELGPTPLNRQSMINEKS